MLTIFEEVQLHRLREQADMCLAGCGASGVVGGACLVIVANGGPHACLPAALFEAFVGLGFFASWIRLRRRQRQLEELI